MISPLALLIGGAFLALGVAIAGGVHVLYRLRLGHWAWQRAPEPPAATHYGAALAAFLRDCGPMTSEQERHAIEAFGKTRDGVLAKLCDDLDALGAER